MVLASLEIEEDFSGTGSGVVTLPAETLNQLATPYITIECVGYVAPHSQPVSIVIEEATPYQGSSATSVLAIGSAKLLTSSRLVYQRDTFPYTLTIKRFLNGSGYVGEGFHLVLRFTEVRAGRDVPRFFSAIQGVTVDTGPGMDVALKLAEGYSTITSAETFSYQPYFSMTMWVKLNSSSTTGVESRVFVVGTDDLQKQRRVSILDDTIVAAAGSAIQVQAPGTLQLGEWTHVAFTVDGNNTYYFNLFINGALVSTGSATNLATWGTSNTKFSFGSTGNTPDASVRQVCVYDQVLPQSTIETIYNEGFAGIGILFAVPKRLYVFQQMGETNVPEESGNGGPIPLGNGAYEIA